jgi:hypothetical protein
VADTVTRLTALINAKALKQLAIIEQAAEARQVAA